MKEIEIVKKYSDSSYMSKEEIYSLFKEEQAEKIFSSIVTYRDYLKTETGIKDSSLYDYSLILTERIVRFSNNLEQSLLKHDVKISAFSELKKDEFILKAKTKAIENAIRFYQIDTITDKVKDAIIKGNIQHLPLNLEVINSYSKAFDYVVKEKDTLADALYNLYLILSDDSSVNMRREKREDVIPMTFIDPANIKIAISSFVEYIEKTDVSPVSLSLLSLYFMYITSPFFSQNDAIASLLPYLIMKRKGFFYSYLLLDFPSIAFSSSVKLKEKMSLCQETLDLTYYLYYTIPYLIHDEKSFKDIIDSLQQEKEMVKVDVQKTILPSFTEDLDIDEIEANTEKMLQLYPHLKRKQAHFYITHCTLGFNYTISQFEKYEKTVYETARTSMDALANLGFYEKKKIGKKFLYSPVLVDKNA